METGGIGICRQRKSDMFGANKIVSRLDEMLTDAINGRFTESNYDETELSRLESKFRQYLTGKEMTEERVQAERAAIQELVTEGKHYDVCIAIGPMIMMKFVCKLTKELELPTIVSLNPIMVDGTGMCGACRVTVGGKVKFACVDGPEFDGHQVNFDEAMQRQQIYKTAEGRAFLKEKEGDTHHGGCGNCGGDK